MITDASYLALLKHLRDKLADEVARMPEGDERAAKAAGLEALAGYVEEYSYARPLTAT